MKKAISVILLSMIVFALCAGCGEQKAEENQMSMIGNPWSDWQSVKDAEAAVGFSFGLPQVIADSYNVVNISTMNNELIQVVYRDGDYEVCVRKQKGEDQDISGDYNEYEVCTESTREGAVITDCHNLDNSAVKQLVSYNGYSWSIVASKGFRADTNNDFVTMILQQ